MLLFTTTFTFAQGTATYYWSDNQKISINTDRSSLILQFNDGYEVAKYLKANATSLKDLEIHSIQGRAVLKFNNTVQGEALEADHWSDLANNYEYYTTDSTDATVVTTSLAMFNSIVNSKTKVVPRAEWSSSFTTILA